MSAWNVGGGDVYDNNAKAGEAVRHEQHGGGRVIVLACLADSPSVDVYWRIRTCK